MTPARTTRSAAAVTIATAVTVALAGLAPGAARADGPPCPVNALDCLAVTRFSATAGATSDALFVTSLALPVALELGRGVEDDTLRRGGALAGAVGVTALASLVAKYAVRRDRPYTYNRDPGVVAFATRARGNDHSFFSGHTSLAFAALTSAALLYDRDDGVRPGLWAAAGALGAATGMMRIRAGQHFPTDVIVGAAVGTGAGIGVGYLLAPEPHLDGRDLAAFGGGIALGALAAALAPIPSDTRLPLGLHGVSVAPTLAPGRFGLTLAARLR
ncbi:MAG TPA: phosphatase PAP2 family protein [Kofleriaceae bacterium]|nr:phosphatase PAP2 family protein [Kofleriaceae bacterium]